MIGTRSWSNSASEWSATDLFAAVMINIYNDTNIVINQWCFFHHARMWSTTTTTTQANRRRRRRSRRHRCWMVARVITGAYLRPSISWGANSSSLATKYRTYSKKTLERIIFRQLRSGTFVPASFQSVIWRIYVIRMQFVYSLQLRFWWPLNCWH